MKYGVMLNPIKVACVNFIGIMPEMNKIANLFKVSNMMNEDSVDLEKFVETTLVNIYNGIVEANNSIHGKNSTNDNTYGLAPGQDRSKGEGIEFDLLLSVKSSSSNSGDAGVTLKVLLLKGNSNSTKQFENASRVKFTVSLDRWVNKENQIPINNEQP